MENPGLLQLPNCILEKILQYLSYHEISQHRRVSTEVSHFSICLTFKTMINILIFCYYQISRRFDGLCQNILNSGFRKMKRIHRKLFESLRLENSTSERR